MIKVFVFTTWCQIVLAYPTPGIPLFLYPLLLPSVMFFTPSDTHYLLMFEHVGWVADMMVDIEVDPPPLYWKNSPIFLFFCNSERLLFMLLTMLMFLMFLFRL